MTTNEIIEEIMVKSGVDVSQLPDRTLCTQLCAILKKLGGDPDSLPDKLLSTQLGAILECCGGSGGASATQMDALIDRTITDINSDALAIGKNAFAGCERLKSAVFPLATRVSDNAFKDCTNLEKAEFPCCGTVGANAFYPCVELAEISFPNLTSVAAYAFQNCIKLNTIDFPKVTSISQQAMYKCTKMTALVLRSPTLCSLGNVNALGSTPISDGTGFVYVPRALIEEYKTATNWSTYANQFRAIEDYPEITGG